MPTVLRPSTGLPVPSPTPVRKGDDLALLVFILLVVLGVVAVAVSFVRM